MRSRSAAVIFVLVAAGFLFGLFRLFSLRFQQGDIFPPYSSLRADPLGCKGLAEAAGELPGIAVSRNHLPLTRLKGEGGRTILYLGANRGMIEGYGDFPELRRLAREGNRVVVAVAPAKGSEEPCGCDDKKDGKEEQGDKEQEAGKEPAEKPKKDEKRKPQEETGVTVELLPKTAAAEPPKAVLEPALPALPPFLPLRSRLAFKVSGPGWRTVYALGGNAMMIERNEGKGALVLLSDPDLLSNEALRSEPPARFVAWLLGDGREVVFDESHFGIADSTGIMTLVRKFSLLPLLGALIMVAGLFVWKNGVPFAADPAPIAAAGGRDRFSGTVNLLRRHLPMEALLATLLKEWRKSAARELPGLGDIPKRMEATAAREGPEGAAERYDEMVRILSERKKI